MEMSSGFLTFTEQWALLAKIQKKEINKRNKRQWWNVESPIGWCSTTTSLFFPLISLTNPVPADQPSAGFIYSSPDLPDPS